jgi:hypothetical protein
MDRISALRNIEEALAAYEADEQSLPALEQEVRGILRTYATEFADGAVYRAHGDERAEGLVVVAGSRSEARERVATRLEEPATFEVERVE